MAYRKVVLANDEIYHVFNRGVEEKIVFSDKRNYDRFIKTFVYYQKSGVPPRFSLNEKIPHEIFVKLPNLVEIIAYCLMPTHFHFLLKQKKENGISQFLSQIVNSYTRYFNTRHKRKGHLFQGPFKAVRVENDEQLMHLSRYIHLNPSVDFLVKNLKEYEYSSYLEYLTSQRGICQKNIVLSLFPSPKAYEKFVLDREDYGRRLNAIKRLTIEISDTDTEV